MPRFPFIAAIALLTALLFAWLAPMRRDPLIGRVMPCGHVYRGETFTLPYHVYRGDEVVTEVQIYYVCDHGDAWPGRTDGTLLDTR